ncbi:MAG: glutathione synthase [Rickettsiales bacterium]|nr:glutathione synthase [Rickettsiales bacterium]|tara:strand:- start:5235 stop:6179 length:945 start_codon:yes stop_codon:yes gene_type:complete
MHALFVMDPISSILVDQDSSYALMIEWQRRGGSVWHCGPADLWSKDGQTFADASLVKVGPKPKIATIIEQKELSLADCKVVFKRTDPPFDMRYVFSTYLLDQAGPNTLVCNRPAGLRDATEKMVILRFPELIAPTLISRKTEQIRNFIDELGGKAVIKPWDGNGGRGIFVLDAADRNLGSLIETSTLGGQVHAVVQAYLPEISDGDKRIILVNGVPKGAFLRIPPKNDHRGNIHVGAIVKACEMTEMDHQICAQLAPYLRENGLIFTGIDVIGDRLTEVNVTSPTGLQECTRLYGTRIEADIVDAALNAAETSQ